jgi:NDP-sugar pyrophosphorylase family protein
MITSVPRRAVILAGGLGTRLRPYTVVLPKPLMPVGDRPVLDIVIRQLRASQFDQVTMATGYLAELIEAFFRDGGEYGIPIDYYREHEPLGTVGALGLIDGLDTDFLVMNGDILTDLDYAQLLSDHERSDAIATIATRTTEVQISLGVLDFADADDATLLTNYFEKPNIEYESSMGVYCFDPRVRDFIEPGERLDFPDLMLRLVHEGEKVRAWRSNGFWLDIGRPADYEQAQDDFEALRDRLLPE